MPSTPSVRSVCLESAIARLAGCGERVYRRVFKAPAKYNRLDHAGLEVEIVTPEGKKLAEEREGWIRQRESARRVANIGAGMALIAIGAFAWSTKRVATGLVGALVCISVSQLAKKGITRIFNDLIKDFASDIQHAERLRERS